jgi:DnaJ-class molecular chaperone
MRTHYDNLKVAKDAPPEVIRAAYKVLCQKYHPDKHKGNPAEAERIMKIINASYAALSDEETRKAHDRRIEREEATRKINNAMDPLTDLENLFINDDDEPAPPKPSRRPKTSRSPRKPNPSQPAASAPSNPVEKPTYDWLNLAAGFMVLYIAYLIMSMIFAH